MKHQIEVLMPTVQIKIKCGEVTCASKPGTFCGFVGSMNYGQDHVCMLFPSEDRSFTILKDENGWLQRCPACLKAQTK